MDVAMYILCLPFQFIRLVMGLAVYILCLPFQFIRLVMDVALHILYLPFQFIRLLMGVAMSIFYFFECNPLVLIFVLILFTVFFVLQEEKRQNK